MNRQRRYKQVPPFATSWYKTLQYIVKYYQQSNCSAYAAALTLDTLLSLVPLLAASIVLFAMNPKLQAMVVQAEHQLLAHFVVDTGQELQTYLEKFSRQAATVSKVGVVLLVLTSLRLLYSLHQAFNAILRARVRQKTWYEMMFSCLAWLLAPVLLGASIATSSYIMSLDFIMGYIHHIKWLKPLLAIIPVFLTTIAFSFAYIVVSKTIVPIRYAICGAFSAALLFEASKWLFGLYILHFPSYQVLYGALAAIPLFLLWLYVAWQVVLLGAVIAQALAYKARYRSTVKLDGFTHAIIWIGYLWQAEGNNQSLTLADLVARDKISYQIEPEVMLQELRKSGFIAITKGGKYKLARDIGALSIADCYTQLPWKLPVPDYLQQLDIPKQEKLLEVITAVADCQKRHLLEPLLSLYQDTLSANK